MNKYKNIRLKGRYNTFKEFDMSFKNRLMIVFLFTIIYTLKTSIAYHTEFSLGIDGLLQQFIAVINPFTVGLLLLSLSLFARRGGTFIASIMSINIALTFWLLANVLYYREFSDFISINLIMGVGNVIGGLGGSTLRVLEFKDIFYLLDSFIISVFLIKNRKNYFVGKGSFKPASLIVMLSTLLCVGNLALAEFDRPELLTRTFDKNYLVKYLGLVPYLAHDTVTSYKTNQVRALADESGLVDIQSYIDSRRTDKNDKTFGIAEGRDVVYLHLESTQQFLIDYKLEVENEDGEKELLEVTPFLNSLFHSEDSLSFENVFHQVGGGKTSDAEMMNENSLFGTSSGSAMAVYGGDNEFFALPEILGADGYESAVFHGNTPSFWNRTDTYKNWGYDHFYSLNHFEYSKDEYVGYGLLDEPFYNQSYEIYKNMESPKLTKFIPVTTHFPYENTGFTDFPKATTNDETINGYFAAANYSDNALKMFVDKLKADGTYDNTIFVLYGDHYGHSNMRNPELATILKDKEGNPLDTDNWSSFDNSTLQRIPLIFHIPNADIPDSVGNIQKTFGGQIDILPTFLRLMGKDANYIQMGQDLMSNQSNEIVVFRNGNIVSPKYTIIKGKVFDTVSGEDISDSMTSKEVLETINIKEDAALQLKMSDTVMKQDLLRFYNPGVHKKDKSKSNFDLKYKNIDY